VALDSGRHPELGAQLLAVFESQVAGGKRYDLGAAGRRSAHAVFGASHAVDTMAGITWAVDLSPVVAEPGIGIREFLASLTGRFARDVERRLESLE
jgi:hypothetical protein